MFQKKIYLSYVFIFVTVFVFALISSRLANSINPLHITSFTPTSSINTSPVELTIQGTGFTPDSEVRIVEEGPYRVENYDTPGHAHHIIIRDNYAYVADGESGLLILDISDRANPVLIGSYDTAGSAYGIALSGNYAYVADRTALLIIDITDPTHPGLVGIYNDKLKNATRVAVKGNYAYVVDGKQGLKILDISDQFDPFWVINYTPGTLTGTHNDPFHIGNYRPWTIYDIAVSGNYAFITSSYIYDYYLPFPIPFEWFYPTPFPPFPPFYPFPPSPPSPSFICGCLQALDITNPAKPTPVGHRMSQSGGLRSIIVKNDCAYVTDENSGFQIIDISDPTTLTVIGSFSPYEMSYPWNPFNNENNCGLAIHDEYAYIVHREKGLTVIDISDPTDPKWGRGYNTPGSSEGVAVNENHIYIADGVSGLQVMEKDGLANSFIIGSYALDRAYDVAVSGDYALVVDSLAGFKVINISNPADPLEIASYSPQSPKNYPTFSYPLNSFPPFCPPYYYPQCTFFPLPSIDLNGNYAYLTQVNGFEIVDINDPANLNFIGSYSKPNTIIPPPIGFWPIIYPVSNWYWPCKVYVKGNHAYMINYSGLEVIDISDPSNPTYQDSFKTDSWVYSHSSLGYLAYAAAITENYAYLVNGSGFYIIDVSDPTNVNLVFSDKTDMIGNKGTHIVIRDNYAYIIDTENGFYIIDISDPKNPTREGSCKTHGSTAYDLALSGNYAYVTDMLSGLRVIDISDPKNPLHIKSYSTPTFACGTALGNDYAYVADMNSGLQIIEIPPSLFSPSVTYTDTVTLHVDIPPLFAPGSYKVMVKNPDGQYDISPEDFYSISECSLPCQDCDQDGYTKEEGDYNDHNASVYPGAPELCDGLDNDYDQIIPPNEEDKDQDGSRICEGDCDDLDATVYPGASELCDGKDNDCDQIIPDNEADEDEDGYRICEGDCNDQDAGINPQQDEIPCNNQDDDCDSATLDCPLHITTITPASSINTSPVEVTLQGTGFTPDSEVSLCYHLPSYLPMTGQKSSYHAGDDGDLQIGMGWPDPRFIDNGDGTITDELTGLIWYKDASVTGSTSWTNALSYCNNSTMAGYTDWRLPNALEMFSLFCPENYNPPIPNDHLFNGFQTGFTYDIAKRYWISNSYYRNNSWYNYKCFFHCNDFTWCDDPKGGCSHREFYFIPVRGESGNGLYDIPKTGKIDSYASGDDGSLKKGAAWAEPRFTDNGDGTVTDNQTNLVWVKDAQLAGEAKSWKAALDYCNNLDYAGHGDWHLPNVNELISLIDFEYYAPDKTALPPGHSFVNTNHNNYWTSTSSRDGTQAYVFIKFIQVKVGGRIPILTLYDKSEMKNIWPVRVLHSGHDNAGAFSEGTGPLENGCAVCSADYLDVFTLKVTLPSSLPSGMYDVVVKNSNAETAALSNAFEALCVDCDNDGYTEAEGDCNDYDATIYPGASELCDGKDNDCDLIIPDNEADEDQDGYRLCEDDCDDLDEGFYPGASELCDGKDNDCDLIIPDNEADEDQDGYRLCDGDCDDLDADVYPGAWEIDDGKDNDCDGYQDEDVYTIPKFPFIPFPWIWINPWPYINYNNNNKYWYHSCIYPQQDWPLLIAPKDTIWMMSNTSSLFPFLPLSSQDSQIQELFPKYIPEWFPWLE